MQALIGTNTDLGVSGDESTSLTKTEINAYRQAAMEDVCGTRCHMRYGDVAREEVRQEWSRDGRLRLLVEVEEEEGRRWIKD